MTERVSRMLNTMKSREYRKKRKSYFWDLPGFWEKNEYQQSTWFLTAFLERQEPVIHENDIFGFNRHLIDRPGVIANSHTKIDGQMFYERYSNICPAYELAIDRGFDSLLAELSEKERTACGEKLFFCQAAKAQLEAVLQICDRYRTHAKAVGCHELYTALLRVPRQKPTSLYEALVFQKILVFALRCAHSKHLTFGRFDQYMYPYYLADKAAGRSDEDILELLELYFISLNLDSDLYPGVQQGDNGQSMVLGGYDLDGNSQYNELTRLCIEASLALTLIDPKINLRVNKTTPDEIYTIGTQLTKQGLGFPQYCNDDVIVPGLIKLGYRPEDAANYAVAACWEPIIPGLGADIPNELPFSFPLELSKAIESLDRCPNTDTLLEAFDRQAKLRCEGIISAYGSPETYYFKRPLPVSPLISLLMHGCLKTCTDISRFGARYYNCGAFGAGLSTAADSIAAIENFVIEEKCIDWNALKAALNDNFESHTALRNMLMSGPKMGGNSKRPQEIAERLMASYIRHLNGKPNGLGGVWRCGTGSAQNYIYDAANCPASADGRKKGEPYACSFSPAPGARVAGPLSVIGAFTSFDLSDCINGGPLTMELHHNVFRNPEGESKVAQLVKLFILSGGHQLQLNTLNRDTLLEAQLHPENHRDLVVRVWGWSGYFCELDIQFQEHILARTQYTV